MKFILNEQTKPHVKRYYINKYLNFIECNNLDINDYKEIIEKLVEKTISMCLENKSDKYVSSQMSEAFQEIAIKKKIKRFHPKDIFLLAKNNPKYINNLYNYYENRLIYYIYDSTEGVDNEKVDKAKEMLKAYFDDININKINNFESFRTSIENLKEKIYFKLKIKTKYLDKADKYKSLLSKEKLKIYIESIIDKYIENYFNNNHDYSLSSYLSLRLNICLKELNSDIVLIKYARIVNNDADYDYAIDYYLKKYEYILDDYDKNYGLMEKYKELIEKYVRNAYLSSIELYLKRRLNEYVEENAPKSTNFNLNLARGSNEVEKQRHRHILLTDFEYKIDLYKNAYKFYDSEKIVDKKLREIYINVIDTYINGISNAHTNRYLSTLLKQRFKLYSKSVEEQKYFANILYIITSYYEVLEEYYDEHTLTYTKKGNLEEYMELMLDEYIENGCYEDDHKGYFRKMIENYESIDKSYVYEK